MASRPGYATVGLLLSADEGYSLSVVESIYPDPSDFIRLNGKASLPALRFAKRGPVQ